MAGAPQMPGGLGNRGAGGGWDRGTMRIVDVVLTAFVFGTAAAVVVGGGLGREALELSAATFAYAGCLALLAAISRSLPPTPRDPSSRPASNGSSRWTHRPP